MDGSNWQWPRSTVDGALSVSHRYFTPAGKLIPGYSDLEVMHGASPHFHCTESYEEQKIHRAILSSIGS